jgi:hypothetical protein
MDQVEEERRIKEEADLKDMMDTIVLDDAYFNSHDLLNKGKDVHPSAKQRRDVLAEIARLKFVSQSQAKRRSGVPPPEQLNEIEEIIDLGGGPRIFVGSGPINKFEPGFPLKFDYF